MAILEVNTIGPYIVMSCLNTFYNLPLPLITLIIDQIMELSYQAETWWVSSPLYIFFGSGFTFGLFLL